MKTEFQEKIEEITSASIPMHMPGHKRNTALLGNDLPYGIDITEIEGADDLHSPEAGGMIYRLCERLAHLYRAKNAYPLVGGSTCGILAAIRTLTRPGEGVIVARNCHRSVWHAIEICSLRPTFILPPIIGEYGICGRITPEAVDEAFSANPTARAVILTSPTYEGILSDTEGIAAVCRRHGAALFVDAAHGAHLGLSAAFPDFPRGADIAVTSLHKTLPALTQTALGLVFNEKYAPGFARNLAVFETSSPSYILMSSIAKCADLIEERGEELFEEYRFALERFFLRTCNMQRLSVMCVDDLGKLVISTRGTSLGGPAVADHLRKKYHIEPEMVHSDYILLMTSVCDTYETLIKVADALCELDRVLPRSTGKSCPSYITELPGTVIPLSEAVHADIPDDGEISNAYVWVYPPGIPILLPGEVVTDEVREHLKMLKNAGISIKIAKTS